MAERVDRERSVFLSLRVQALREEVKSLSDERQQVQAALHGIKDKKSAEAKALKQRFIYVTGRIPQAKEEIQSFGSEKRALVVVLANDRSKILEEA